MEPWGPIRADINAGIIASTIANCHRDSKRRPDPFTPADFMPRFGKQEPKEQSEYMEPGQILAAFDELIRRQQK